MLYKAIFLILVIISTSVFANNYVGFSLGTGKPDKSRGARINYQRNFYTKGIMDFRIDCSYAHWHRHSVDGKNLQVFALGPWLQLGGQGAKKLFFNASVAVAHKSSKQVGTRISGSKWTFQDILGVGVNITNNLALSVNYLHYSNADLATPNPGIEILPLIMVTYRF